MDISLLTIFILSCKSVSLICLLISIHSYHWFQVENYSVNKSLIESLCISYGAFCNKNDEMPLPRSIVIIPCVLTIIGLILELINLSLLCSIWQRINSMLNFLLELTSIALSSALTIHCTWVTAVHIRISMEISIVHLDWTFFAFTLAAILIPIDSICSMARVMHNCQYGKSSQPRPSIQLYTYRHKSIVDSDI